MSWASYCILIASLFFSKVNKVSNEVKNGKILPSFLNVTLGIAFKNQIDVPSSAGRPKVRGVHKPQEN